MILKRMKTIVCKILNKVWDKKKMKIFILHQTNIQEESIIWIKNKKYPILVKVLLIILYYFINKINCKNYK